MPKDAVMTPDDVREETLTRLVSEYEVPLQRVCCLYLHDPALAEDAVQETFLKAYNALDQFRGECSEKSWLMRIAVNVCRDMRRGRWFRLMDRRVTPDMLPESIAQPDGRDIDLTLTVMQLPDKLKEVVILYFYQRMSMNEIADALGIAQSSVSHRLQRAKERLYLALEGGYRHG